MNRPSLTSRLAQAANPEAGATPKSEPVQRSKPSARALGAAKREVAAAPAPKPSAAPARIGKTMIAGYFSAELAKAVRVLAAERGVTIQALIGEGLDVVLRQAGKHPMGER